MGLSIWAFALFGSSVATFVGCRGWLGRIMGHGSGWVVVRGSRRWVTKMVCGLLWWLCCELWWWLGCGLWWVANMVVLVSSLTITVEPMRKRHWGSLLYSLNYCILCFPFTVIELYLKREECLWLLWWGISVLILQYKHILRLHIFFSFSDVLAML